MPVKVKLGKTMFAEALLKFSVKLRKLVREVRFVGEAAEALVFVRLKSCTLPKVAPAAKVIALLMLLA